MLTAMLFGQPVPVQIEGFQTDQDIYPIARPNNVVLVSVLNKWTGQPLNFSFLAPVDLVFIDNNSGPHKHEAVKYADYVEGICSHCGSVL